MNPPRMPQDEFAELSFCPDPVPNETGGYKPFTEVYGTDTTDNARPSLTKKAAPTENDKKNAKYFVAGTKSLNY